MAITDTDTAVLITKITNLPSFGSKNNHVVWVTAAGLARVPST